MNNNNNNNNISTIEFLGVGNSHSKELASSSCLFKYNDTELLIDYGPSIYHKYQEKFNKLPENIFITHCHFDHIGGLENLFYKVAFMDTPLIKLFVPSNIVHLLHRRMGSMESMVAEGGVNFWDVFQLIPVEDSFWLDDLKFTVFQNRHHYLGFSFGISLEGSFLYSGDTKTIPEIIGSLAGHGELIFHDASVSEQPSHSFLSEIKYAYKSEQLNRMWLYHLSCSDAQQETRDEGFNVVDVNKVFTLKVKA
jgi:ribonuclease BN (tRNA processing enzyme)